MSTPTPKDGQPPAKPRLKLNVSRSSSFVADANATPSVSVPAGPAAPTPTPTEGSRKVKLKIGKSQPSTPAEQPPVKTKAGRQPKPTQKLVESKKRAHDELDDELGSAHPTTKIKLKPTKSGLTPTVVVKPKGRAPVHPPGDGYDSEASDREKDPSIEEQFVLRMLPGEHCDYVRSCMENGKMGVPRSQGGADIQLRFFEEDSRRAVVSVKGQPFAAVMVDLPTVTEAMKTWDRKSFLKSADICQMLLVYQKVSNEAEARQTPLPSMIDQHFKWPHGLTPPMHDCVNRRFAKTISRKEIEDKEAEVERLLAEDAKAGSTRWEWVDESKDEDEDGGDEDAEGDMDDDGMDYFQSQDVFGDGDDDLAADLEAAFGEMGDETPATGMDAPTPMTTTQANTPAPLQDSIESDESEEVSDDDDDDDDDEDLDEDARAQRDEEKGVKSFINDLKNQLTSKQEELARTTNKILRTRIEQTIKQLRAEIELKNSSIGIETDD
ncbi:related to transcription initiation factor TFIID subunit [Fusarium fujikuroi]|uniref:Related to transcription initiation factor TFIID subunit n=2 Tax=Fusarium fujikuroi TaxID=5127 RepID=S0DJ16_GIBF5|nr:related to transcription initiation factor TFIID subunit [Fusarium fujikuroi IMI 58289]KLP04945.1 transcription initiation factor TFIID subunit [Fusarium fujikuroi]KLP14570.1 transcription initiation factor TFIID subunit [Fusarium fujikuroi]CCT62280.1 related to transcription initiation factor TFIID subunit [Fusarium fujikuroi IMI 58289]SCN67849.1 related to transcription initiation factor TFIID subunit [Fusarium fujikuroi]SCN71530.1 related to transcription initiation factor TFIID subunit 